MRNKEADVALDGLSIKWLSTGVVVKCFDGWA